MCLVQYIRPSSHWLQAHGKHYSSAYPTSTARIGVMLAAVPASHYTPPLWRSLIALKVGFVLIVTWRQVDPVNETLRRNSAQLQKVGAHSRFHPLESLGSITREISMTTKLSSPCMRQEICKATKFLKGEWIAWRVPPGRQEMVFRVYILVKHIHK